MNSSYNIIPRIRKPSINPGEKIEIEIFLSGYGNPDKNKFVINFSSPNLTKSEDPGYVQTSIRTLEDVKTGKLSPLVGKDHL